LKNLGQLRVATLVGCPFWIDIGSAVSRTSGVSTEKIAALPNYRNSELFSVTEKLVLEYADGMTQTPVEVPDALFAKLREKFSEAQLVELTSTLAWENYRARFDHAFGVEAEGFSKGSYCALPARAANQLGWKMSASATPPVFLEPKPLGKIFNKTFGYLVGLGIGPGYMYLLQVRGRKSGRLYETPVNVLDVEGKRYLVAPRGRTQWVRNAQATGEITLKKGRSRQRFQLQAIADGQKPALLKLYLDSYVTAVQRYFTVKAGSAAEAFREVAPNYPVFELLRADKP
jgi:deazaflavin-dependent oxidoreductase (nitroreductase family)